MAYCEHCGHVVEDRELSCIHCGNVRTPVAVATVERREVLGPEKSRGGGIWRFDDEDVKEETFKVFDFKLMAVYIFALVVFIAFFPLSIMTGGLPLVIGIVLVALQIAFTVFIVAGYALKMRSLVILGLIVFMLFEIAGAIFAIINMGRIDNLYFAQNLFWMLGCFAGVTAIIIIMAEMLGQKRYPELGLFLAALVVLFFIVEFIIFCARIDYTEVVNFWLELGWQASRLLIAAVYFVCALNQFIKVNRELCY